MKLDSVIGVRFLAVFKHHNTDQKHVKEMSAPGLPRQNDLVIFDNSLFGTVRKVVFSHDGVTVHCHDTAPTEESMINDREFDVGNSIDKSLDQLKALNSAIRKLNESFSREPGLKEDH